MLALGKLEIQWLIPGNKTFYSQMVWIGYNIELADEVYCTHMGIRRRIRDLTLNETLRILTWLLAYEILIHAN